MNNIYIYIYFVLSLETPTTIMYINTSLLQFPIGFGVLATAHKFLVGKDFSPKHNEGDLRRRANERFKRVSSKENKNNYGNTNETVFAISIPNVYVLQRNSIVAR